MFFSKWYRCHTVAFSKNMLNHSGPPLLLACLSASIGTIEIKALTSTSELYWRHTKDQTLKQAKYDLNTISRVNIQTSMRYHACFIALMSNSKAANCLATFPTSPAPWVNTKSPSCITVASTAGSWLISLTKIGLS